MSFSASLRRPTATRNRGDSGIQRLSAISSTPVGRPISHRIRQLPIADALLAETIPARHRGTLMIVADGCVAGAGYVLTSWLAGALTTDRPSHLPSVRLGELLIDCDWLT
jgi:hypothetical protein